MLFIFCILAKNKTWILNLLNMIVDNPERPYLKYLVWWKYTEE